MRTVKTAISVDEQVFHRVERLAKRLHVSRSQFFTQAARHMIQRDENLDLLRRINAAYEQAVSSGTDAVHERKVRAYARRKAANKW